MKASIDRDANAEGRRAKATVLQAALTARRGPADSVPGVLALLCRLRWLVTLTLVPIARINPEASLIGPPCRWAPCLCAHILR
jgi:hypothetical protein